MINVRREGWKRGLTDGRDAIITWCEKKLMWNRRLARLENMAQELKNRIDEMNEKK